ncbi:hypothetical protein KCP77_19680 [Salmonella enterica subsp. enterica]|nr:hypothetical protein KCP77_19680 [Salmonella enterica subsp. enterica]
MSDSPKQSYRGSLIRSCSMALRASSGKTLTGDLSSPAGGVSLKFQHRLVLLAAHHYLIGSRSVNILSPHHHSARGRLSLISDFFFALRRQRLRVNR